MLLWVAAIRLLPSPAGLILSLFIQLPLFMAGLGGGRRCAALASVIFAGGALACLLQMGGALPNALKGVGYMMGFYGLPVVALSACALARPHGADTAPNRLVTGLTVLGYSVVVCKDLVRPFIAQMELSITQAMQAMFAANAEMVEPIVGLLKPFLPIVLSLGLMIIWMLNGALAQRLLVRRGWALRPSPALIDLQVPPVFLGVLAVTGVLGYAFFAYPEGQMAANLAAVTLVPYFLMGLGTVQALAQRTAYRRLILGLTYLLIALTSLASLVVTLLGIFEPWLNLRNKLLQKK